jgi:hypothetical protein
MKIGQCVHFEFLTFASSPSQSKVQVTILGKLGYSNANPSKEEKQEMKDKAWRTIGWV